MRMISVKILGQVFEGDFLNPDMIEKRERAIEEAEKLLHKSELVNGSEGIRKLCDMTCACADEILGDGAAQKLFPDGRDLLNCLDLFKELCEMEEKQLVPLIEEKRMRYSAERARREIQSAH